MQGLFFTFEGVDFCGKSTQIKRLVQRLEHQDIPVLLVREPGGTDISEAIREILLDTKNTSMHARTELLLYTAARAQIVAEKIVPALAASMVVICDRFIDSTTAYQGYGRELGLAFVQKINEFATQSLKPDATIWIDIPLDVAEARRKQFSLKKDRLEGEARSFRERVVAGYQMLADAEPNRIHIIDGNGPIEDVEERVWQVVSPLLTRWQDQ